MGMLHDSVFVIRETAMQSLIDISKQSNQTEWLLRLASSKISEFSKHDRFMIRIQAVHFINRVQPEATKDVLNKNFVEVLLLLAEDPVPNIRFNVAKTIESLYARMTPGSKIKCEGAIKKMCNDKDFDAAFFAKKALATINKH